MRSPNLCADIRQKYKNTRIATYFSCLVCTDILSSGRGGRNSSIRNLNCVGLAHSRQLPKSPIRELHDCHSDVDPTKLEKSPGGARHIAPFRATVDQLRPINLLPVRRARLPQ